ncbi:MAG: DUF494 family protein [Bacteroidetes bacterium]|nr:DUF494 family protein [Bacteroidota bacterium]
MYERIVEIILFLVSELKAKKRLSDVDVTLLTREGYTQSEISTAFSWLFDQLMSGKEFLLRGQARKESVRQLNDFERSIIQPDAYGYLLQCQQLGLLSNEELETLIEQILSAGFSAVGISEVKSFVAGILFSTEHTSSSLLYNSNDTIH